MDRILFGDNQFFGVNHMSEERARAQAMRFQSTEAIIGTLVDAYEAGIRVFMCTTHARIAEICDYFREHRSAYPDFEFYPCMPYAHKYANAVTEHGIAGALKYFLPSDGRVSALLKGGVSMVRRDAEGIGKLLIDAEMDMFRGLATPVIFLQNVVTDLLLGLGALDAFCIFARHVRERYDAEPGFITMNLPRLVDALQEVGLENPIICANINKIGFRTSGGLKLYEDVIASRPFRAVAMSVFASGAVPPKAAIDYISAQPRIESILFGASSRSNIVNTVQLIQEADAARQRTS